MLLKILLITLAFANPALELYNYQHRGKTISMPVGLAEKEQVRVNDICLKDTANCQALKVWRGKTKPFKADLPGNMAGAYCRALGGSELFTQKDFLFCVFSDLSAIDGQALYLHHQGGKR